MTYGDARTLLDRERLQFGNETHIQAVRILEDASELRDLVEQFRPFECGQCAGQGQVESEHDDGHVCYRNCPKCNGTGHVDPLHDSTTAEQIQRFIKYAHECADHAREIA